MASWQVGFGALSLYRTAKIGLTVSVIEMVAEDDLTKPFGGLLRSVLQ